MPGTKENELNQKRLTALEFMVDTGAQARGPVLPSWVLATAQMVLVRLCVRRTQEVWTLKLTQPSRAPPRPCLSTFVQNIVPSCGALKGNDFRRRNFSASGNISQPRMAAAAASGQW